MLKNGCYAFLLFNHINLQNRTETVNGCIDSIIDTMQVRYARHTPNSNCMNSLDLSQISTQTMEFTVTKDWYTE